MHMPHMKRRFIVISIATLSLAVGAVALATDAAHNTPAPAAPRAAANQGAVVANAPVTPAIAAQPATASTSSAKTDPIPVSSSDFYNRQAQLQGELALLKLQSQIADVKKKIADASSDVSLPPPASVIVAPPASMTPQSGAPGAPARSEPTTASLSLPFVGDAVSQPALRVTSVLGVNGSYTAQLVDHGVDCTVSEGTTLSDGWRVTKIAPSTVVLVRGRARRILHVSG